MSERYLNYQFKLPVNQGLKWSDLYAILMPHLHVAFHQVYNRKVGPWNEANYIVSQARPNLPQCGSLSVSYTGKERSGDAW